MLIRIALVGLSLLVMACTPAAAPTPTLAPKGHNIRLTQHTWDPQLHAPHTSCPTCLNTFIGDYFGIASAGGKSYTTSVTTYDDGTNHAHYQQQVIAILAIP